jgi:hypothetical protein
LIIMAGTKVECSLGHACGEITSDIDTQRIVVRDGDHPPFVVGRRRRLRRWIAGMALRGL